MLNKIVHKIETSSKTSLRTHAASITWLFSGQIFSSTASLALTVVMANSLSAEAFGSYKYLLTLFGVISIFSLTGLSTSTTRAVSQGYEGEFKVAFITSLRYSGLMFMTGLIISLYYLWYDNLLFGLGSLLAAFTVPLITATSLYTTLVNGRHDHKTYSLTVTATSTIPPLITLICLILTKDILILFSLFIISQLLTTAFFYLWSLSHYKPNDNRDRSALNYGKHLSLMNILGGISYQLDKLVVWHFLGPAQLAIYTLAIAPAQQLRYLNKITTTVTLPRFSLQSVQKLQSTILHKMALLFVFSIILVIGYISIAPALFLYFVPTYTESVLFSQVFALIILFFPSALLQDALKAQAHTKALYVAQTFIPSLKIFLLCILTPIYGIWGVLLTMFTCETARLIIVMWYVFYSPQPLNIKIE